MNLYNVICLNILELWTVNVFHHLNLHFQVSSIYLLFFFFLFVALCYRSKDLIFHSFSVIPHYRSEGSQQLSLQYSESGGIEL